MITSYWKQDLPNGYRIIALLLIIAAGFAIRLHDLDHDSFWLDEIFTVRSARLGIDSILGQNDHPPLLYGLTAASINAFDEGEFGARIPSMIAGTLAIAAIALLGKVVGAPNAGLWAALLLSFSPLALRYSQEVRHYALLLLFSLLSYCFLFQALQRPKWSSWLAYAAITILNLYTHYGALIVLFAQGVFIALWSLKKIIKRQTKDIAYPAIVAGIILALYVPWIPRLLIGLERNVASERLSGTGGMASLGDWLQVAYTAFGMFSDILAPMLLGLCLLGHLYWLVDQAWMKLGFILSGLVLPLILVLMFQVSRGAFARYIVYMLPFFLLAAGYAIDRSLFLTKRFTGRTVYRTSVAFCLLGFVFLARPTVTAERERISEDWREVIAYLKQNTQDNHVIASMSLSDPSGFNKVNYSLPYYLSKEDIESPFLEGNEITTSQVGDLDVINGPLWGIVTAWNGLPIFADSSLEVTEFQTHLYIVKETIQDGSTLDSLISLYEKLIPWADSPSPLCFMKRDLATFHLVAEEYSKAEKVLIEGKQLCPQLNFWNAVAIYEGLLGEQPSSADPDKITEIARKILIYDAKNIMALDSLTAFGLLDLFEQGEAQIVVGDSPEPVGKKQFTMPQDGDWGDVIFAHPPAAINFNLSLPDEPMMFRSRIALAPDSWEWGGDGVTFILRIQDESGNIAELFRDHVGNNPEDHKWHNVLVPLGEYAGQSVILSLITESGPAGDGTGDWAGWESPRIMWDVPG